MITEILLVFSFVCFVVSFFWEPEPNRHRMIAAGLAFYVLSIILAGHPLLK